MVYVAQRVELNFTGRSAKEIDSRQRLKIGKNFLTNELSYTEWTI